MAAISEIQNDNVHRRRHVNEIADYFLRIETQSPTPHIASLET